MTRRLDSAEEWLAYLLSGEVTAEDRERLEDWLGESLTNRAEFELLQQAWQLSGELKSDPDLAAPLTPRPLVTRAGHGLWRRGGALAAAAAVVLVLAATRWRAQAPAEALRHQTALGEQRTVTLVDGSKIRLNTATTVDIAAGEQRVELLDGEALFDVQSQPERDFVVDTGIGEVRVLGTRFNVLRQDDGVLISVLEGRVAVDLRAVDGQTVSYRLKAGETLEADADGRAQRRMDGADLDRVRAWQDGKIEFDHTPLRIAVRELNRYTPEALSIAEPRLEELLISGVFRIERLADLSSVRFALENSLPVKIEATADALELIPAGSDEIRP